MCLQTAIVLCRVCLPWTQHTNRFLLSKSQI